RRRMPPALAAGRKVAEKGRQRAPARACAPDVDVRGSSNVSHRIDGFLERRDVRVESAVRVFSCGVAPAHYERMHAAAERPLYDALERNEVKNVVFVDLRRDDQ